MRPAGKLARRVVVLAALALALPVGCGGSSSDGSHDGSRRAKKRKKARPDEHAVSEDGKQWGGWRWKGRRDDCFYLVDNECFADEKAACRAAGCGPSKCELDERTAPIKVRCDK